MGHTDDADGACPYQGGAPFEEGTREVFFGRGRPTRGLLDLLGRRLREGAAVLLVSGGSGVGKSSLLRAGLMPALATGALPVAGSREWPRMLITPAPEPMRALAEAWARAYGGDAGVLHRGLRDAPEQPLPGPASADERPVLVVDQFEELFTLVDDERERRMFVQALHALAEGPLGGAVIIAVRADHWDRTAAYPRLAEAIQHGRFTVEPMAEPDLRLAVTGPAAAAGLDVEPGLLETLLADLRGARDREAGALPLLSRALVRVWRAREDGRLTVRGYEESGPVGEVLCRTADETLERLPPAERKTVLKLLRRMTAIGPDGRLARRTAPLAALDAVAGGGTAGTADRGLLALLADRRLITLHEDTAEIVHDVLVTDWPPLRRWLSPGLRAHAVHDRLLNDAARWDEHHRDPAFLYRGSRLLAVQDARHRWEREPGDGMAPGPVADDFVAASARAARRRRRTVAGLVVLALLALAAAFLAGGAAAGHDGPAPRNVEAP
jgi:hypothetical protein